MRLMLILLTLAGLSFSLGLEELINSALEKNSTVNAKRFAVQSSKLNLKADRSLYYPEFFAGYRLSWQSERQSITIPSIAGFPPTEIRSSKSSYQSFQLGLRQTLYDGGLRSSKVSLSEVVQSVAEKELEETLLEVKLEVIKAYLSVLSSLELLEVVKKQRETIRADLTQREAFFREGLVAITDVLQARVRLAEVERDLRQAEGNYRIALSELSRLTGIEESRLKDLSPPQTQPQVQGLEELLQRALSRPSISLTRERLRSIRNQRRAELSQFYPKVFVEAVYNYSDQNPNASPKGFFVLSGGVSMGFQYLSGYYRALALAEEEKKAREELREVQELIALGVRSSYEKFMTARDNLRVAEEALRFAEEFYRLALQQYRNQIISGYDLLQAEASLTQARRSKVVAYYELLRSYYELMREVGEL